MTSKSPEGKAQVANLFGANLVRLRKRLGISQEELAFRASLHRTEVGQLERGVRLARIDTLVRLAGSLEVDVEALLAGMRWWPGSTQAGSWQASIEADEEALEESKEEDNGRTKAEGESRDG